MGVLHMDMSKWPSRFKTRTESGTSLIQLESTDNNIVYTPLKAVNSMLDLLPKEIWSNTDAKFLDPCCKSGIFLEQIFWRLDEGLKHKIPDFLERSDHILTKQLYGLSPCWEVADVEEKLKYSERYHNKALYGTENVKSYAENCRYLLYGAARANDKNAFTRQFDNPYGNIRAMYRIVDGKFKDTFRIIKGDTAYELKELIKEVFGEMKFDVIIGNPPYQENNGGGGSSTSAVSLYDKFVFKALELCPRYISMIIPARWYSGGAGTDKFREMMLNNKNISTIVDYQDATEVFNTVGIRGGVCYFLIDSRHEDKCRFISIKKGIRKSDTRALNEFNILIRDKEASSIIHKVRREKEKTFDEIVSACMPFGIETNIRGRDTGYSTDLKLVASDGVSYIDKSIVTKSQELIDKYKVIAIRIVSGTEASSDGTYQVMQTIKVIKPGEVCTKSFLVLGYSDVEQIAYNICNYFKTKFARFMLYQAIASITISRDKFCFVPIQDFSKPWTDAELYAKYNLTQEEIDFIESTIKPMK